MKGRQGAPSRLRLREQVAAPRSGQTMVMMALMLTVFFGMTALVVDLGYVMIQRRQQQNAADAAARGVAKALAGSVGIDSLGSNVFLDQTDLAVLAKAQTLASGNWVGPGVTRTIGIEYLNCSSPPAVIRTALAGSGTLAPSNTCYVRATGTSAMNSLFARVLSPAMSTTGASAQATARIAPTTALTSVSGIWPITRWKLHPNAGNNCLQLTSSVNPTPRVFWSNNGGSEDTSIGPFKEKLFFSRYSQKDCSTPYTAAPLQVITLFDPARPGQHCANASTQQLDLEYWFTNGFGGTISVGNQIEVTDPGNQGHNYSNEMVAYVNAKPEGTHATWGNYRTVHVAMWEQGHVWNNGANDYICWNAPGCAGGPPDRVTLSNLYCFRFYTYWIQSSEVRGFRVGCLQDTPPVSGPPGAGANTVQMVD